MTEQTSGGEEAACEPAVCKCAARKAADILGNISRTAVRSKEVIITLYLAFLGHLLNVLSSMGQLKKKKKIKVINWSMFGE